MYSLNSTDGGSWLQRTAGFYITNGGQESEANEDHVAFTDTHLPD